MGLIEVLRTRADKSAEQANAAELALRRDQDGFRTRMEEEMASMRDSLEQAQVQAEAERKKGDAT